MRNFIAANDIFVKNGMITYIDFLTREKITKKFDIKLSNLHKKMKNINYKKQYNKAGKIINKDIENYAMMPFAYVYYYYIAENLTIPTPQEFVEKYFQMFCVRLESGNYIFNEKYLINNKNIEFKYNDLKCRILRSYNSFNREIEFLINLYHNCNFDLEYKLSTDLFDGIDLIVKNNNKIFGIAEYVYTKRSESYKKIKNNIRHDYSNIEMIDIIAKFNGPEKNIIKYGDIFCYNESVMRSVIEKIKNNDCF